MDKEIEINGRRCNSLSLNNYHPSRLSSQAYNCFFFVAVNAFETCDLKVPYDDVLEEIFQRHYISRETNVSQLIVFPLESTNFKKPDANLLTFVVSPLFVLHLRQLTSFDVCFPVDGSFFFLCISAPEPWSIM